MTLFACCGLTRLAAAGEDSTAVWWRESHPIVVVIVVDGLRGDALEGDAPWDGPLMPRMRSERNQCLRWTDVWTEFTDRDANYRQLLTGCSPANALVEKESVSVAFTSKTMASEIWAPESESFDLDELRARLDRAVSADHGTVLVLRLRDLVFPLRVDVRTLQRLDPRPWSTNSAGPVEIKELTAKRLRQAIHVARSEQPLDVKFSDYSLAIYQWVVDAGHRVLDRKLDHILRQLSKSVPPERLGWILTSTGATAYRRHGLGTMGQSAVA